MKTLNPKPAEKTSDLSSYSELKHRVRDALSLGRVRAEKAYEREFVRGYWEIGKLIQGHILLNQARADYGAKVMLRLSADLGISYSELKSMREFARTYPIGLPGGQLSWAHYKALLAINEDEKRNRVAAQAVKGNWTRDNLRREIAKLKAAKQIEVSEPPVEEPLVPLQGKLDTYRIVTGEVGPWKGRPLVDTGFANYEEPVARGKALFKEGDIVRLEKGGLLPAPDASAVDLYTYRAYLIEVTDGDTIWMLIDLGFGVIKEHLRLRGIDAPEITTQDGRRAKRFIEQELARHAALGKDPLIITSTRSDKYDRYLADIFYRSKSGGQFLNNRLLEEDLAAKITG